MKLRKLIQRKLTASFAVRNVSRKNRERKIHYYIQRIMEKRRNVRLMVFSYEVGRQSMSAKGGRGEVPPYYKKVGRP